MTFWDHLDVLRNSILRILAVAIIAAILAFYFKEWLFDVVLLPSKSDFITYRLLRISPFYIHLINTGLTEQFMIHVRVSLAVGILISSPYILYILYGFISPALYEKERLYSSKITISAYSMFLLGVIINYFLVFPLTVRFLGTYQVSSSVENMLTITSYVDTLLGMSIAMGLIFEIPVISWLLARYGLLRSEWMSQYRRHSIVAILILAAVITPTTDILTLIIVSLPIWLLYEVSILIVKYSTPKLEKV